MNLIYRNTQCLQDSDITNPTLKNVKTFTILQSTHLRTQGIDELHELHKLCLSKLKDVHTVSELVNIDVHAVSELLKAFIYRVTLNRDLMMT